MDVVTLVFNPLLRRQSSILKRFGPSPAPVCPSPAELALSEAEGLRERRDESLP
jgi:hypothetical protein